MNELHQTILDAARDEVARGYTKILGDNRPYLSWEECWNERRKEADWATLYFIDNNAALLAMEKQAEFFRWASKESYAFNGKVWYDLADILGEQPLTELELYEIWEGQKK